MHLLPWRAWSHRLTCNWASLAMPGAAAWSLAHPRASQNGPVTWVWVLWDSAPSLWLLHKSFSSSLWLTNLALLSYFPKHLNSAHPRQQGASQPISWDLLLASNKPPNHPTIFPSLWCFRPAGAFEGKSRHGQERPCFIWVKQSNLMFLVESWQMCYIYS